MQAKKVRPITAIVLIIVFALFLGGTIFYMYTVNRDRPQPFFAERRGTGQRLMAEVQEFDLENNFPETPEEIIGLYVLLYELIYGRIVECEELLWDLIGLQRQIFGEFLTQNNTHQEQFDNVIAATSLFFENNIYIWRVNVGVFYESEILSAASVPITKTMINNPEGENTLFFNYFLRMENGRWKIHTWERTDRTFRNPWVG